jgi:cation transport ATPase
MLLSGDRQEAVQAMAAAAGIDPRDAFAGVRPADKAALVRRLQSEACRVAMVSRSRVDACHAQNFHRASVGLVQVFSARRVFAG